MYPNLYYAFSDLFGIEIPFFKLINSFGFFVAMAFVSAGFFLTKEFTRYTNLGSFPITFRDELKGAPASIQEIANYYDIIISIRGLDREKKDLFKLKKIISTSSLVSQKEVINQIEQLIEEETIWRNVAFKFLINYLEGIGEVKKAEKYKILMKNYFMVSIQVIMVF